MIVRTQNSIFHVQGKGDVISVTKISTTGNVSSVQDGDVILGVRLICQIGDCLSLYDSTGDRVLETSTIQSIEG